uniref:Uncharacterized protein n=4 Tax=Meloidogyne enterolobii TaxID=390850 RepID=A0A6V7WPP0_MELEN|nr:unnamed protein product [Meloidogyne enterolobii]
MRRNLPITTTNKPVPSSLSPTIPNRNINQQQNQNNLNRKKQHQQNFQHQTNKLNDQGTTLIEDASQCCYSGNVNSTLAQPTLISEKTQIFSSVLPSSGFNLFEEEDIRRENAFKGVMIVCLCISVCAWASLFSVCPVLYQFLNFTTSQFDGMLKFCEENAQTMADDSTALVDVFVERYNSGNFRKNQNLQHFVMARTVDFVMNRTKNRNFRHIVSTQGDYRQLRSEGVEPSRTCRCGEGEVGVQGTPGRKGMRGTPGAKGAPGIPARLPCEPLQDLKKYCPEKCPQGLQGPPGQMGAMGDNGNKGPPGLQGKNGDDGKTGARGMNGPPGVPGLDGEDGDPGQDAQPTPFIPGPSGPTGEVGMIGPSGPRGLPGIDGPQGPQGRKGAQGEAGRVGTPGTTGPPGPIGESGDDGHKGVCPTYCAMDGGVFFVEPPEWFFKNKRNR